jgi:DNA-binding MarR family transcriptional regulator
MNQPLFDLVMALKRKCAATEARIQEKLGLTQAEYNGVMGIDSGEVLSGSTFAERMGLSPSRASRVTARLVERNLLAIEHGTVDRREIKLTLTAEGATMRASIARELHSCERNIMESLPSDEREEVKRALARLIESM